MGGAGREGRGDGHGHAHPDDFVQPVDGRAEQPPEEDIGDLNEGDDEHGQDADECHAPRRGDTPLVQGVEASAHRLAGWLPGSLTEAAPRFRRETFLEL